jgi:hypothetical protein
MQHIRTPEKQNDIKCTTKTKGIEMKNLGKKRRIRVWFCRTSNN